VAGPIVGVIANCLPVKSTIISYGQLSEQKISGIDPIVILGKNLKLEGFLLSIWLRDKGLFALYSITKKARTLIEEVVVNKAFGLHEIHEAMAEYKANMGKGKVLLKPSLTPSL
jgi:NADPH:quinone reductase-like Zn-dependent oxidoreductase